MKITAILGVTVLLLFLTLFEYPKINHTHRKEKKALSILLAVGWLLAVLLILFPEMPGPTQLLNFLFGPMKQLL